MTLDELFVVYNELSPENEYILKPKTTTKFVYSPLERIDTVRKVIKDTKSESPKNDENTSSKPSFFWEYSQSKEYKYPEIPLSDDQYSTKPSMKLLQYLKDKEKFKSEVYTDSGGVKTIGYGFTDPEIVKIGKLTEQEASQLLEKDIETRRNKLKSQIVTWDKLNQNQQDALISYGFNVGVENWKRTQPKLLAALNEERFNEASKYINAVRDKKGTVLPGLVKRRKEEQEWFNGKSNS